MSLRRERNWTKLTAVKDDNLETQAHGDISHLKILTVQLVSHLFLTNFDIWHFLRATRLLDFSYLVLPSVNKVLTYLLISNNVLCIKNN